MDLQLLVDITALLDHDSEQIVGQHGFAQYELLDSLEPPMVAVFASPGRHDQRDIALDRHKQVIEMMGKTTDEYFQRIALRVRHFFRLPHISSQKGKRSIGSFSGPFNEVDNIFLRVRMIIPAYWRIGRNRFEVLGSIPCILLAQPRMMVEQTPHPAEIGHLAA
jgi:hypothetical protein